MNPATPDTPDRLNEFQKRRLRVSCEYIDKLLSSIEEVLYQSSSKSVFPKFKSEVSLAQRQTIENYIARIRAQLLRVLDGQDISQGKPSILATHSIRVSLTCIEIAVEELYPKSMQGYGAVPEAVAAELNGICGELLGLVTRLDRYVSGDEDDLKKRLERLAQTSDETTVLHQIEKVVRERGLVEFHSSISAILERAEDRTFEIAVFGRVSSGKSSLLNAIVGADVLPVGVTPVTAVPTRIAYGEKLGITVWFADHPSEQIGLDQLSAFVTEQQNPGNERHVTRVVVQLPAKQLRDGVTFVDTPGLGSLATRGAAETLAYLPKCDMGVVLVDAASSLTPDDLQTILALNEAAVPVTVLLSKADLIGEQDQQRVVAYVKEHIKDECKLDLNVQPVSAMPAHRALLDRWFENDIVPVYASVRDLRTASLKRKVGALRESVAASLKGRLRKSGSPYGVCRTGARDRRSPPHRYGEIGGALGRNGRRDGANLRQLTGPSGGSGRSTDHVLDQQHKALGPVDRRHGTQSNYRLDAKVYAVVAGTDLRPGPQSQRRTYHVSIGSLRPGQTHG